jgi:hypothetical protein
MPPEITGSLREIKSRLSIVERRLDTLARNKKEQDERNKRCCNQRGAADYLNCSRERVRLLVKQGRLKKNALNQYDYSELDALLDEEGRR